MTASDDGLGAWHDALIALQVLQIEPHGLGGVWLRAPHGPVRERWLQVLAHSALTVVKLPGHSDAAALLGGMDLSATLHTGRLQLQSGLLQQAHGGVLCVPMAERLARELAALLLQAMDTQSVPPLSANAPRPRCAFGVVALDESQGDDDPPMAAALQERLGLCVDLSAIGPMDIGDLNSDAAELAELGVVLSEAQLADARRRLRTLSGPDHHMLALVQAAQALGIDSLRVPTLAWRAACAHAALNQRAELEDEDVAFAARLVLAPRARRWPASAPEAAEPAAQAQPEPKPEPPLDSPLEPADDDDGASREAAQQDAVDPADAAPEAEPSDAEAPAQDEPTAGELLVAAALASLPPQVLDRLRLGASSAGSLAGRQGPSRAGGKRGRPLPPRPGRLQGGARLHVLATLRAAVPHQAWRTRRAGQRLAIRSSDLHVQRHQQHSASCLILAVDASGSSALQRLAEAKGAVELLLQQSYARRDQVCIVAFKGAQAQLLVPATRSLVRAKRAMTGLPGGGGTPLASALKLACEQALLQVRQGLTPMLVVLSDGHANVNLQGIGGRSQALTQAHDWCRQWRALGHSALWIDTAVRADPKAQALAQSLAAAYLPMPQVQAQRMAQAVAQVRRRDHAL